MTKTDLVTREHVAQFRDEGYFVLDRVLTDEQLELLRGGAQYSIDKLDAAMDAAGTDTLGINHRGKRYFSNMIYQDRPELRQFLFSDTMADICRATLGDDAYLFWEQYVIKAGDPDTAFAWHQDSGYVHEDHEPYLTCWIALDDVTEENGSVYLLPYSRSGIRSYIKHIHDPELNDMVCYFGSDPGIPMTAAAGSIVVFSSVVIHRSGPNRTDRNRRVYLAQYSKDIIPSKDGTGAHGSFDPFLKAGQIVADR
jgi:ectoine hydroxylase-related dioxygenase (phytanoyl-CoA dioxygenase family)